MPTLPEWCSQNPSAIVPPPEDKFPTGFVSTDLGQNYWLNYFFNLLTLHTQVPVGTLSFGFGTSFPDSLLCNGDTIGPTGSGATHAGDQYKDLWSLLWYYNDTMQPGDTPKTTPVIDWDNGKYFYLPDLTGTSAAGQKGDVVVYDNQQVVYGEIGYELNANVVYVSNPPHTPNYLVDLHEKYGEEEEVLSEDQLPTITPTINDPGHFHTYEFAYHSSAAEAGDPNDHDIYKLDRNKTYPTESSTTGITFNPFGSGDPHSNVQPSMVGYWYIKY